MRPLLSLLLVACASAPVRVEPLPSATPWCVAVTLAWRDGTEAGLACGSTRDVCESVRAKAVRFGSLADIRSVGQCRRKEQP